MTSTESLQLHTSRDMLRIDSVLQAHHQLSKYRNGLSITIEGTRIVVRGQLPSVALKQAVVPAIRQAGVLGQICNCVEIG